MTDRTKRDSGKVKPAPEAVRPKHTENPNMPTRPPDFRRRQRNPYRE